MNVTERITGGFVADRELALAAVWRDRTGTALVAEDRQPGQEGPKDRLRQCGLECFFGNSPDRADAILPLMPVEVEFPVLADPQQFIDESDDPALRGHEQGANQLFQA